MAPLRGMVNPRVTFLDDLAENRGTLRRKAGPTRSLGTGRGSPVFASLKMGGTQFLSLRPKSNLARTIQ